MLEIKRPNEEELSSICEFQIRMAMETENLELDPSTVIRGVRHLYQNPEFGYYLIAKKDNETVASLLVLKEWSDWRARNVLWIHSLYVLPNMRGQKVFRAMYDQIKGEVEKDDELAGIRLYVDKTNLKAQDIYQKIGMSKEHYDLYEWLKDY